MAIYGINFNGKPIPDGIQRKFTRWLKRNRHTGVLYPVNADSSCDFTLQAVAQSPAERDACLVQANNGHRQFHVVERKTAGGIWYGIYIGYK